MFSSPKLTLPTRKIPVIAYSLIEVSPKRSGEPLRPTTSLELSGTERTLNEERVLQKRRHETRGNPEASVSVHDATIRATPPWSISAAFATTRWRPCWGGVAPAGLIPPRPAPPNPYGVGSTATSTATAGAASLPLPLPLPFLPLPLPLLLALGAPFSSTILR